MRRRSGTAHPKHPSPTEVVALVNGVTASIGGVYLLTSSTLIAALAGGVALVAAGLFFVFDR
ncbi:MULTISPECIES: hypothetical protein [unclassified Streptomyces]|uniref:hypothetical protein n=1 Tax=unclassified Streptomyces TaxID=2593676 RepID=UPI000AAF7C7E|nr:hypothetical protein [Streptomyces sp. WM6378]